MERNFTASDVVRLFRAIYNHGFRHVPQPHLRIYIGDSGNEEACGMYWPDENLIEIWLAEHEELFEVFDTLVHELCHAEQEKRGQDLLHGRRFSRRIKRQKQKIRKVIK